MYNGHRHQAIHLHGHSHFTDEADLERKMAKELNESGFKNEIYNVGCMYWNYEPVTLDEILRQKAQSAKPAYETVEFTIDSDLYEQAGEILKRYGLTHEEATLLFFKETVRLGRIPFDYTQEDLLEAKCLSGEVDDGE